MVVGYFPIRMHLTTLCRTDNSPSSGDCQPGIDRRIDHFIILTKPAPFYRYFIPGWNTWRIFFVHQRQDLHYISVNLFLSNAIIFHPPNFPRTSGNVWRIAPYKQPFGGRFVEFIPEITKNFRENMISHFHPSVHFDPGLLGSIPAFLSVLDCSLTIKLDQLENSFPPALRILGDGHTLLNRVASPWLHWIFTLSLCRWWQIMRNSQVLLV